MAQEMLGIHNYENKNNQYNKKKELTDTALLGSNVASWGVGISGILKNNAKLRNIGFAGILASSLGLLANDILNNSQIESSNNNNSVFGENHKNNNNDEISFLENFFEEHDKKDIATTAGLGISIIGLLTGIAKNKNFLKKAGLAGILVSGLAKVATNYTNEENYITIMDNGTKFQDMLADNQTTIKQEGKLISVEKKHTIEKGETLWKVSQQYGTNVNRLKNDNNFKNGDVLEIGQEINVKKYGYVVNDGDTLEKISEKLGVDVNVLATINKLEDLVDDNSNGDIELDKNLVIEVPSFVHTVKKGETLTSISKNLGVSATALAELNNLSDTNIEIGQKLQVVYNKSNYNVKKTVTKGFYHTIQKGDSVFNLASRYEVSMDAIKKVNNIKNNKLILGTKIIIPVDPKKAKLIAQKQAETNQKPEVKKVQNKETNSNTTKISESDKKVINRTRKQAEETSFNLGEKISTFFTDLFEDVTVEEYESSDPAITGRKYLKIGKTINGKFQATRFEFEPTTNRGPLKDKVIIINAGHGYITPDFIDYGARPKGIENEWLVNYDNAIRLTNELRGLGATVIFMQGKAKLICNELKDYNKRNKADLFISIHANAGSPAEDRMEVLLSSKIANSASLHSNLFAKAVKENFSQNQNIQTIKHGNTENVAVLNTAEKHIKCPAVTWEVAFMDQKEGQAKLKNPDTMRKFAKTMSNSIVDYFDKYSDTEFTKEEIEKETAIAKKNLRTLQSNKRKERTRRTKKRKIRA